MQFAITDRAAITLAAEFYAALGEGYPVDMALTEARKAIFAQQNSLEWATPVLYLRAPDGRIFDIAAIPSTRPRRPLRQSNRHLHKSVSNPACSPRNAWRYGWARWLGWRFCA